MTRTVVHCWAPSAGLCRFMLPRDLQKQLLDQDARKEQPLVVAQSVVQSEVVAQPSNKHDYDKYDSIEKHQDPAQLVVVERRLEALRRVFCEFDMNNEGSIDSEELLEVRKSVFLVLL